MAKRDKEKKPSKKKEKGEKKRKKSARKEENLLTGLSSDATGHGGVSTAETPSGVSAWSGELASRMAMLVTQSARGLVGSAEHAAGEVASFIDARISALVDELRREYHLSRGDESPVAEGQTAAGTEAAVLPPAEAAESAASPQAAREASEEGQTRAARGRGKSAPRRSPAKPAAAKTRTPRATTTKGAAKRSATKSTTKSATKSATGKASTPKRATKTAASRPRTSQGES